MVRNLKKLPTSYDIDNSDHHTYLLPLGSIRLTASRITVVSFLLTKGLYYPLGRSGLLITRSSYSFLYDKYLSVIGYTYADHVPVAETIHSHVRAVPRVPAMWTSCSIALVCTVMAC